MTILDILDEGTIVVKCGRCGNETLVNVKSMHHDNELLLTECYECGYLSSIYMNQYKIERTSDD